MPPHTQLSRWRADPILFIEEVLIDPETQEAFVLLDAERSFLRYAFSTDPESRLIYHEQIYSCPRSQARQRSLPST